MSKLKSFIASTIIGGLLIILPIVLLFLALKWVFDTARSLTGFITANMHTLSDSERLLADTIVFLAFILLCFLVGVAIRTRLGKWIYALLEKHLLMKTPGFSIIKETVGQFLGNKKSPFSSTALVQLFGNETMVSAFVTDEHEDGRYTVFVPTGPNPTSGNIYHLPADKVHKVDAPVDEMMRSIISCGAGSSSLVNRLKN